MPVDPKNGLSVEGLARVGDYAQADSLLHAAQAEFPQGTIWNDYIGPELETFKAMAAHRPKDAIAALERSRPVEGRSLFLPMLRADAYLAEGELDLAEKEYRRIVEGPLHAAGVVEIPLSWLGLGRALAAEGKRVPAVEAYQHFFHFLAHADPDATFLIQAENEFKALQESRPAH